MYSMFTSTGDVCNLPLSIGSCNLNIHSYFYNSTSEKCETFVYGGCYGNANRFQNYESCQRLCYPFQGFYFQIKNDNNLL